ncbi:hypothetical protein STSP2_01599 [Anaerohalosphaera lusitana]|uniref:DUF4056 domain-containing protein n=1 Tax=Anaerohalosphaera lusitana TaxID=1936003 RepID=A0A1U9NKU2_9BACT|nr:DUF4056 domain-containing protein [Anaerohalosphaera lusitana]AQT68435.1 hypothetical protein STSP2_01599 [Anaerohalosphaera lusitana]
MNTSKLTVRIIVSIAAVFLTTLTTGCSLTNEPRPRLGSYATDTIGTNFLDMKSLGNHSHGIFLGEGNGIAYTCRGGHIDIAHLRISAEYTKYLHDKVQSCLTDGDDSFTFTMNVEPTRYYVKLDYPPNWDDLSAERKKQITDQIALDLGQYLTFTMVTWHEVLTWFNFKGMGVLPEFPSAFSWEDSYSNLLGTRISAAAIKADESHFDKAVTLELEKEMEHLGIKSRKFARQAAAKMRGEWYVGAVLVDMRERNMDIGLDDGYVTPTLVPGVCENAQPLSYPAPTLDSLTRNGFAIDLEVQSNIMEMGRILKVVKQNPETGRIDLITQLPVMMRHIEQEAISRGYNTRPSNGSTNSNPERSTAADTTKTSPTTIQ